MKLLLVHSYYQQRGGEDVVFDAEAKLLEQGGQTVRRFTLHNDAVVGMGRLALACATVWNRAVYREIRALIRKERPDIVHFYNTFPLISPAAYYAAKAEGVPVVQRLANFRLLCSNALFLRGGRVCEDCVGKLLPWPGVVHACYRNSRAASGAVATMLSVHRGMRTWTRMVDLFVVLAEFAREKFIRGGLPADKIVVIPNFVDPDSGIGEGKGGYALYVGRLSPEKGVETLLTAWRRLADKVPLRIVGDGPLATKVAEAAREMAGVEWLGQQSRDKVFALMRDALVLILPSVCYENLPVVVVEAYAVGLPVIVSDLGSLRSLVDGSRTGLRFRPGDPAELANKVQWFLSHPAELAQMRREARAEFEAKYTVERHYRMLMEIYQQTIASTSSLTRDRQYPCI